MRIRCQWNKLNGRKDRVQMKPSMRKDFLREIKKSLNRFLSIMMIVALGVAFFAGIRATSPDMKLSADHYYDEENMMDLRAVGTWGLTDEDVKELKQIEGIKEIEPIYSYDVMGKVSNNQYLLKAYSILETVSKMKLVEGRMPEKLGECVVDEQLLATGEFQIGETLTIETGDEEPLSDVIKQDQYEIVGIVNSPMYMDVERGSTTIGNGKINGYFAILKEEFALDVYTEAYMTVEGAKELVAYSEEYDACVEPIKEKVEDFLDTRAELRYTDTIKEAKEKIEDGEAEVSDGEKELEDGKQQLEQSRQQLKDAEQEIEDGEKELADGEQQLEDAKKQLADSKKELEAGEQEIKAKKAELLSGKEELEEGKSQVEEGTVKLQQAKKQIEEAETQISEQEQQLEQGTVEYEAQKAQAKSALEQAKEQLDAAKAQVDAGFQQYEEQEKQALEPIEQAKEELAQQEQSLAKLKETIEQMEQTLPQESEELLLAKKQYEEGQQKLAASKEQVEEQERDINAQLEQAKAPLLAAQKEYEDGLNAYNTKKSQTESQLNEAKEQLEAGEAKLKEAKSALEENKNQLLVKEKEFEQARQQLIKSERQIKEGEQQLEQAEQTILEGKQELEKGQEEIEKNSQTLEESRQQLEEGKQDLEKGKQELKDAEQEIKDGELELKEAKTKLKDAKAELADLDVPEYYSLDRGSIISAVSFGNDADRIKAIGEVFPAIFFLVAALVSLTTMTRMVESDRTQIGTLKALGYGKRSIAMRYILYALLATVIGSLIGMVIGQKLFPTVIITAYQMMYQTLPGVVSPLNLFYSVTSCLVAIVTILIATIFACYKELQEVPAGLMRPVAPKVGKRVLLERVPMIWNRLSFTSKVTVRNLFRYKKRFFMTIFGIGGCMALIIVGFGVQDSIFSIVNKQYGEIMNYDLAVSIKEGKDPNEIIAGEAGIEDSLNVWQTSVDASAKSGGKTWEAYVIVPEEKEAFQDYIHLHNRKSKEQYELSSDGVIISEKLGSLLGVEVGDTLVIHEEEQEEQTVTVEGIVENYLYHYIYMAPELYETLYKEEVSWNQILVKTEDHSLEEQNEVSKELLQNDAVTSVTKMTESKRSISRMMDGMDIVIVVLVVSAGALAFVVLYNLNNINISERKRELATIKVLGFYDMETAEYVYRENVILTIFGILLGLGLGVILHHYVIITAELDMLMLGREVKPMSFVYGALLTGVFSAFVNFVLYYKLKKIDMVESLKSVE